MIGQRITRGLARTTINLKIFAIVLILAVVSVATTRLAFASTLVLSGTVQDSSGSPISGASITVNDGNADTTTTDGAGHYSLSVPSGVYDVQVSPPSTGGFSSAIDYGQSLAADTTLNFVLTPVGTAKLSGHLYDALGNPLAHQTISIVVPGSNPVASAVTDADGYYVLTCAPGKYTISISNGNAKNTDFSQNIPEAYNYYISNYELTQDVMQDISLPAKRVAVHVQDETFLSVSNVMLTTNDGFNFDVSLGGSTYNASGQ